MNDEIPKEVYAMTGAEYSWERLEDGRPRKKVCVISRPSVDLSDLRLVEELGWEDEVTKEQIDEASQRLDLQAKESVWKFLKELTGR